MDEQPIGSPKRSEVLDFLDCRGPSFDPVWTSLSSSSAKSLERKNEKSLLAAAVGLRTIATRAIALWKPGRVGRARRYLPGALQGRGWPSEVLGACAHGLLVAKFWQCMDVSNQPSITGWEIARCIGRRSTAGPVTTQDWGPLELSESSDWPIKVLDMRIAQDHWYHCGTQKAIDCQDAKLSDLRRASGFWRQGDLGMSNPSPGFEVAQLAIKDQFSGVARERLLVQSRPSFWGKESLDVVLLGSHLGSNMEPAALVEAFASRASLRLDLTVYGTVYPWPEMICHLFRHCVQNPHIDEAVGLLVKQMYQPSWSPSTLLEILHQGYHSDPKMQNAELIVCAQPMVICVMLRALTETPMFIYQAFPLVGATPREHMDTVLLNFREMMRSPKRSAFAVYSEFLAVQFEQQVGVRPLCLRPHSLYATATGGYDPDRKAPRIMVSRLAGWAREGAHALVNLIEQVSLQELRPGTKLRFNFMGMSREPSETVAGITQPFGYNELKRFRAAVYFPWDMGMLLFSELYNLGVPLLLPGPTWMMNIVMRMLEYTDFGWWQARYDSMVLVPGATTNSSQLPLWFGANSTMAHLLNLYDLTDFARWPWVTTFDNVPHLMQQLLSLDFDRYSAEMLKWQAASLPVSLDILEGAVGALLGARAEPPPIGASSCV